MLTPWCTNSATCSKSFSTKPREVRAGEPMRMPPGTIALLSPGTVFLFSAMCASSSTRSTLHDAARSILAQCNVTHVPQWSLRAPPLRSATGGPMLPAAHGKRFVSAAVLTLLSHPLEL